MSWTNHLDSRAARVSRIEYRWRLRRKMRHAVAAVHCQPNGPAATVPPARGEIENPAQPRSTCPLPPSVGC